MFVNFPQVSLTEWHPFSISSGTEENEIELNIKGIGNFTEKLVTSAQEAKQMSIRVDGPYGNLNINHYSYPVVFLVVGGIGITPALSILKDFYLSKKARSSSVQTVYLIWTVPSQDSYQWFSKDIEQFQELSQSKAAPKFKPMIYITRSKEASEGIFYQGRPNYEDLLKRSLVENWYNKTFGNNTPRTDVSNL